MAKIYGYESKYIKSKERSYLIRWVVAFFCLFFLVYIFARVGSHPLTGMEALFLAIGFLFIVKILELIIKKQDIGFKKARNGLDGEADIDRVLKKLPDSYSVFRCVKLRDNCDIDFVVVGPTGVFTIEVKSHKGKIEFNGNELTLNGHSIREKNILRQAFAEAMDARSYIEKIINKEIYVTAILVFSNKKAFVNLGVGKVRNVYVIHKNKLLDIIMNTDENILSAEKIDSIAKKLKERVS